jgi:hypothetical protein
VANTAKILRLGIDRDGVKGVERLDDSDVTKCAKGDCFGFIIEKDKDILGVTTQFKVWNNS